MMHVGDILSTLEDMIFGTSEGYQDACEGHYDSCGRIS